MTYYIYELVDPRTGQPFYVGKGKWSNRRHMDHLRETFENNTNRFKFFKIQSIRNDGFEPDVRIVVNNIQDEAEAYQLEENQIRKYGVAPDGLLTNICITNRPPNLAGRTRSDKCKEAHSKYWAGRPKPDTQRQKISNTLKGNVPWNKGIIGKVTQTEESNRARSDSLKAYWKRKREQND